MLTPSLPPSFPLRVLPQMCARGVWPYAFLYQLHAALAELLPIVMPELRAAPPTVVCPQCKTFDVELDQARALASRGQLASCWLCRKRGTPVTFPVTGFVSWEHSVPDSQHGSLVDAALLMARDEVAKGSALSGSHVKHARDKLMR